MAQPYPVPRSLGCPLSGPLNPVVWHATWKGTQPPAYTPSGWQSFSPLDQSLVGPDSLVPDFMPHRQAWVGEGPPVV